MEITKKEFLNALKTKRMNYRMHKKVILAEKKCLQSVLKVIEECDETIKLGGWQNQRIALIDQIEMNLNLAIRYLSDNGEFDSVLNSYVKNYEKFVKQLNEKETDEYFVSLKDKYVENAYQFIPEEKSTQV